MVPMQTKVHYAHHDVSDPTELRGKFVRFLELCRSIQLTLLDMVRWLLHAPQPLEHFARYFQLHSLRMHWILNKWIGCEETRGIVNNVGSLLETADPFVPTGTNYKHGLGAMTLILKMEQTMYQHLVELHRLASWQGRLELASLIHSTALPSHSRFVKYAQDHVTRLSRLYQDECDRDTFIMHDQEYNELTLKTTVRVMMKYFYRPDFMRFMPPSLTDINAIGSEVDMSWIMSW